MGDAFFKRSRPLNIDIGNRCALACLRCARQTKHLNHGEKVPGDNLTFEEFNLVTQFTPKISFCGQYSDPTHHPQFVDFLAACWLRKITAEVHVASTARPREWFVEAFQANPHAKWFFGIDGLPEESHQYRINQDGVKLFGIMLEDRNHLKTPPYWKFIVFKYNEDHFEQAMEIAKKEGLLFLAVNSSRWDGGDDPLKPSRRV